MSDNAIRRATCTNAIAERLFREKPDEKVILVSQWTSALQLLSDYLSERHVAHVKYQGDMSRNARDAAVRAFMAKDKAKVMLMSLKCGGKYPAFSALVAYSSIA